MRPAPLAADTR